MKSVYEYLTESPMAIIDDWDGQNIKLEAISTRVLPKYWTELKSTHEDGQIKIFMANTKDSIILGKISTKNKNRFLIYSEMDCRYYQTMRHLGNNIIIVHGIKTEQKLRGRGYATALYRAILDAGYSILSDGIQYNGARRIYQGLYDLGKYKIDVYNEDEKELIKDIDINHGDTDEDIDPFHWSLDSSKMNLKFFVHN